MSAYYLSRTEWWVRLGHAGWGIGLSDHRKMGPLFSERYNGQFTIPKRRYLHIGPLCLRVLKPYE